MKLHHLASASLLPLLLSACGDDVNPVFETRSTQSAVRAKVVNPDNIAVFNGYQAGYRVSRTATGLVVTDLVGSEGSVTLDIAVKLIEFHDARMSFDVASKAGQAYRIYQAVFNRRPDSGGLGFWIGVMENGTPATDVAGAFMQSDEFRSMYGSSPGNLSLVSKFYENVLRRKPDQAGLDFWVDLLDRQIVTARAVLAEFAESAENKKLLEPVIVEGIIYTPSTPRVYSANDQFTAPTLSTCRWFDWSQRAGQTRQSNGLTVSTSAETDVSLPRVVSQYSVRDDFSIEVSVAADERFLSPIPDGAQKYSGVGLHVDEKNFVLLSLAHEGNRRVIKPLVRRKGAFTNLPVIQTDASDVRLSIGTSNGRLRFRFQDGRGWTDVGDTEAFADNEYQVSLGAATIGVKQAFSSTFKEFTLGGSHSYRPYVRGPLTARQDFMAGSTIESYVYTKLFGADQWGNADMLSTLNANGMSWVRTTVTTQDHASLASIPTAQWQSLPWNSAYWQSREATSALVEMASNRGMNTILSFFFSDSAANSGVQDAPATWRGLSVEQTAEKMRIHTQTVTTAYKAKGYRIPIYEIGNEVEYGVANFRPGERVPRSTDSNHVDDLDYMRAQIWAPQAILFKAAIAGIRSVEPQAKIVLHVSSVGLTPGDRLIKAFYKYMAEQGVPYDIAGLSMPYSEGSWRLNEYTTDCWFGRLQETTAYLARLGKKSMISEASYPNSTRAQVATPMAEFAFTEAGQAAWVREYLRFGNNNMDMIGFMYFYPDWYPGSAGDNPHVSVMESYGLFNADKSSRPALKEFLLPQR